MMTPTRNARVGIYSKWLNSNLIFAHTSQLGGVARSKGTHSGSPLGPGW